MVESVRDSAKICVDSRDLTVDIATLSSNYPLTDPELMADDTNNATHKKNRWDNSEKDIDDKILTIALILDIIFV